MLDPPALRPMPDPPKKDDFGFVYLGWVAQCCDWAKSRIPYGDEPDTLTWDDPDEAFWKERGEKQAVEEERNQEVIAALQTFLEDDFVWPEASSQACFLARERLTWAAKFATALWEFARFEDCGLNFSQDPDQLHDHILWLAIDCYDVEIDLPRKWWDSSSVEDRF